MATTYPCGQPSSSLRLAGGTCHAGQTVPRQDVNSPFLPWVCRPSDQRCSHTRRFGTLAGPPPPVDDMPWRPIPLAIILITASSSPKMYNLRPTLRRVCVCGNMVHMRQLLDTTVSLLFGFVCVSRTVSCLASVARRWVSGWFGTVR